MRNIVATKRAIRSNHTHLGMDAPRVIESVARHSACEMLMLDLIDKVVESDAFSESARCEIRSGSHRLRLSVLTPSSAVLGMYRGELARMAIGA